MKKLLLTAGILSSAHLFSQNYIFTQSSGTFTNLSGSTSVVDWQKIPLGFTFNFFNQNYDSLYVRAWGYIFFNEISSPKVVISSFETPQASQAPASISYQVSGTIGNRIFKLEWNNVILNNDPNEYISYQMWLYEGSNCISIFIGSNGAMPSSSYGSYPGPDIGLGLPESNNYYSLYGDPNAAGFILSNDSTLTGTPANGTIYNFCSGNGIADNTTTNSMAIFPNPCLTQSVLRSDIFLMNATLTVYNSFGQIVKQIDRLSGRTIMFERGDLPGGLYVFRVTLDGKIISSNKLVIADN